MKARLPRDERVTWDAYQGTLAATDLCYLLALREEGFGEERLRRVMNNAIRIYTEYRNRYCVTDDLGKLSPTSPHIIAMADELATSGFLYERELRLVNDHKFKWHGNHALENGGEH